MSKHTPGDTVYSQHGEQAVFVASAGGEHLVRPIFEDDDGEHVGGVVSWGAIFTSPPSPKLDEKTAAAEKRLAAIREEVAAAEKQPRDFQAGAADRLQRIKQHEGLAFLDAYLAGEITHYVAVKEYGFGVEIIPIGETVENYSSSNGYGLLTLMPSMHWDKRVNWTVHYRDQKCPRGYGGRTEVVFPCRGEEEAKARAAELIEAEIADQMTKERKDRRYTDAVIQCAGRFGVDVPQELVDSAKAARRSSIEREISEKAKQIDALRLQLQGAQQ